MNINRHLRFELLMFIISLALYMGCAIASEASKDDLPIARNSSVTKALGDAGRDLVYVPVTPCRIVDTRKAGGIVAANSIRNFDIADVVSFATQGGDTSNCGVGNKGSFAAAAINIVVVNPNSSGYVTAFPYLASTPSASTVNYAAGSVSSGFTIVALDQSSAVYELSIYSYAQAHLIVDIVGYFTQAELPAQQLPPIYWATSTGRSSCPTVCNWGGGVAAATSTGYVCKRADGSSHRSEIYVSNSSGIYYGCGGSAYMTAQCSCIKW